MPTQSSLSPIRVMLVANNETLIDNVRVQIADSFPIQLVEIVGTGRHCKRVLSEVAPNVLLITEGLEDRPAFGLARDISLSHESIGVVILSQNESPDYLRQAFSAGARGVVRLVPSGDGHTIDSIEELTRAITRAYEYTPNEAKPASVESAANRVIVAFSAKGGVGVSSLTTNLAATAAVFNAGSKTLYLDLNLQFGTSPTYLDITQGTTVAELAPMAERITQDSSDLFLTKDVSGKYPLYVLPAPFSPRDAEQINDVQIKSLLVALRKNFDFVVIDTPSVISEITLAALQSADHILLACTLDVLSVMQTKTALNLLRDPDLAIPQNQFSIVLNKVPEAPSEGLVQVGHLEDLFDDVPVIAFIPNKPTYVQTRVAGGEFLISEDSQSPISLAYQRLADQLGLISR